MKYRTRTEIRKRLPWFLVNLGIAGKGKHDCGDHEWYLQQRDLSGNVWRCAHCEPGIMFTSDLSHLSPTPKLLKSIEETLRLN